MKTRSGLTIKTVPSVRRLGSRTNVRIPNSQQASIEPETPKLSKASHNCQNSKRSMSCLSFVTRYNMLISGTKLDLSDVPNKAEDAEIFENEMNYFKWEDNIENWTDSFRAQLNELGLYARDECRGVEGEFNDRTNVLMPEARNNYSVSTVLSRDVIDQQSGGSGVTNNEKNSHGNIEATSTVNQKSPPDLNLLTPTPSRPTVDSHRSQPIHSKTKVVLTISPSTKPSQPHSFGLGENHLVQAQLANGQPLLYNNIPVMVVNRLPSVIPDVQPMSVSPWKPSTSQQNSVASPSVLSSDYTKSPKFSPRRNLRCDIDKEININDTDEDDSSDTCSQGSQDSNISDFDLSIFQMETHAFAQDANGNQIHKCKICDRVFTVFSAFKTHVNSHVKVKNRCIICGKIFSRSWLLKGHMRTHTGLYFFNSLGMCTPI